ncbi:hypothetical protein BDZ94DRAFT_1257065 [Collybia nuda]|uniref:Uncharacterized protein n=1 Tax=Collybia nuda TaxID=64659 RepID=A0A9P6CJA2_9AGAR|nr:hypothetical protein BDZ94DRAFT_1257065 [Collybia nuda]
MLRSICSMSALKINCAPLPVYTPSEPSPRYSCEPACDEQRLQHTPRFNRPTPTGIYTKSSKKVSVTLFEQEDNAEIPTYGRHGLVSGTVYVEDCARVSRVSLKIEGKLESTISEGGSKTVRLVNDSYTLWSGCPKGSERCPNYVPFSAVLPSSYLYEGSSRPLPPSYASCSPASPSFFLRSQYSIIVQVTRLRYRKLDFLTKTKQVKIPFEYYPRTRAHRPIAPTPCFFSTVKTSPEEWYQAFSVMKTRPKSKLEPIHCHIFIPGARVYGLSDTIPFHVQINGPLASLRSLLTDCSDEELSIKVCLLRQVSVETRGQKAWRNTILSEGEINEVPPVVSPPCESGGMTHLDWEGELSPVKDLRVGGFQAGHVAVKDFIVLEIEPPSSGRVVSPFLALQMTVPIRLVTEPYAEETDYVRP